MERKFQGQRRQLVVHLEELENFPSMKSDSAKELDCLADLLDVAVLNLQEVGHHQDLGDGTLYRMIQRKLPE